MTFFSTLSGIVSTWCFCLLPNIYLLQCFHDSPVQGTFYNIPTYEFFLLLFDLNLIPFHFDCEREIHVLVLCSLDKSKWALNQLKPNFKRVSRLFLYRVSNNSVSTPSFGYCKTCPKNKQFGYFEKFRKNENWCYKVCHTEINILR